MNDGIFLPASVFALDITSQTVVQRLRDKGLLAECNRHVTPLEYQWYQHLV